MSENPKSGPDHECKADKISTHREVTVKGGIEVNDFKSFRDDYKTTHKDDNSHQKKNYAVACITTFVSVLYLIATLLIFVQSKRSADIAEQALTGVQRAFVTVSAVPEMQITTQTGGQQSMWFSFALNNSGTTRARHVSAHINWVIGDQPLPTDFTYPDAADREGLGTTDNLVSVIGPKDEFPLIAGPISREFMEKLYAGKGHLYFYGWIRYNDIFDNTPRHVTKFCYELVAQQGTTFMNGKTGQGVRTQMTGTRFNCYDEDCQE